MDHVKAGTGGEREVFIHECGHADSDGADLADLKHLSKHAAKVPLVGGRAVCGGHRSGVWRGSQDNGQNLHYLCALYRHWAYFSRGRVLAS